MNRRTIRNITFILTLMVVFGSLALAMYGLRHNNVRMGELRAAVFLADEEGDDQKLEEALQALRQHVLGHMNADLQPNDAGESDLQPIQLPHKYYRDIEVFWRRALTQAGVDPAPLNEALSTCETAEYGISQRPSCLFGQIEKRQEALIAAADPDEPVEPFPVPDLPATELYVYDFPSPQWSADLAGLSIVVFIASLALLFIRLLI